MVDTAVVSVAELAIIVEYVFSEAELPGVYPKAFIMFA